MIFHRRADHSGRDTAAMNMRYTLLLPAAIVAAFAATALSADPSGTKFARTSPAARSPMLAKALLRRSSGQVAGPMAGVEEIIFAARGIGSDGHWYANFGHWVADPNRMMYRDGGQLCALNLRTGKLRVLLDDPKGGVRDPQVHYDAGKILFSYRKAGSRHYHLYEIKIDGSRLKQITDGPQDDLEAIYLPDGDILFCSSRVNRFVQCWFTQVAVMHRCGPEGKNIRKLSANVEHDNTPWMLPDGQVLFMRWEYVDRSRVRFHHLWTMCPDGTGQMVYYGNMHPGTVMLDAKPIGNTGKVVASFSPGHGRIEHMGHVTVVDPGAGPDAKSYARRISRDANWRDPYAFSEDCFLVARGGQIFIMDGQGRAEVIHPASGKAARLELHEPRPIRTRPRERLIADRTDWSKPTGRLILSDVTHGRNMGGVKRGEIKKLLILETLPKPVNFSGTMEPISLGGTFTLPRILGTVPVEPDGSAYFDVPALRPVFFVALDKNGLSVKRMQSFVSVMPGETTSCVGCHEKRTTAGINRNKLAAMGRPPSRIEPVKGVPQVIDFPRDVQPILDKHCVKCHNYTKYTGRVSLTGDRGEIYSHAYFNLMSRGLVAHGRDANGNIAPRKIGTSASRMMKKIDGSHNKVKVSEHERTMIRMWIESGAQYPGTYAALGTGMVNARIDGAVVKRRCSKCHRDAVRRWDKWEPAFNLTRPDKSLVLLAPLSKASGGLDLCRPKGKAARQKARSVFADTKDADYRRLLANVVAAKKQLDKIKRFDMPGFIPNAHYLREMTSYGALPASFDPARDRIDPYRIDEVYWQSFWHRPAFGASTRRKRTQDK